MEDFEHDAFREVSVFAVYDEDGNLLDEETFDRPLGADDMMALVQAADAEWVDARLAELLSGEER